MTYEHIPSRRGEPAERQAGAPARSSAPAPSEPRDKPAGTRDDKDERVRFEGAGVTAGLILLLLIGVLVVAVVAQNNDDTEFELLWWSLTAPLSVWLLGTALVTLIVDQLVGAVWRRRRRRFKQLSTAQSSSARS